MGFDDRNAFVHAKPQVREFALSGPKRAASSFGFSGSSFLRPQGVAFSRGLRFSLAFLSDP